MKLTSFEALVAALESAGVRYLIAGGLAVVAHGYARFTKAGRAQDKIDIDYLKVRMADDEPGK